MAEAAFEATCSKCGSEIRAGSLFCYNCGGRVGGEDSSSAGVSPKSKDSYADPGQKAMRPAPGMRSAADLRRHTGVLDRKPKRIAVEPITESSDMQLLVVTVVILLFTIVVIVAAFYLR